MSIVNDITIIKKKQYLSYYIISYYIYIQYTQISIYIKYTTEQLFRKHRYFAVDFQKAPCEIITVIIFH